MQTIRWRKQELVLASIAAIFIIGKHLGNWLLQSNNELQQTAISFTLAGISFNYFKHVFLPQVLPPSGFFLAYLFVNSLLNPGFETAGANKVVWKKWLIISTGWILIVLLLGLVLISSAYLSGQYLYNYKDFKILVPSGRTIRPGLNIILLFQQTLIIVLICSLYVYIREKVICYLDKKKIDDDHIIPSVSLANHATSLVFSYLTILVMLSVFGFLQDYYIRAIFFCLVPSAGLFYLILSFWLLPILNEQTFFKAKVICRATILMLICLIPVGFFTIHQNAPTLLLMGVLLQAGLVIPTAWWSYLRRIDQYSEFHNIQSELIKSRTELQQLRWQINPHFLFNTLNTMYGLALREKADFTAESIQKLGDMMRFMLHDTQQDFIPIGQELTCLRNYLDLQQLRNTASSNVKIKVEIEEPESHVQIAPMLLIPLIENAFKYGISLKEQSWIDINLSFGLGEIYFKISNSNHQEAFRQSVYSYSGVGIKNIAERLKILYPEKHYFESQHDTEQFIVRLTLLY